MYETVGGTPAMQFTQAMGDRDRALGVLTGIDVTELDPTVLGPAVLSLTGQSRRLGAVQAAVADRFATSGAWVDAGARSARAWVASQSNEPAGRVGAVIDTGRAMRAHTHMAAAFAAGEVTARHVDILAGMANKYPSARVHLEAAAEEIVDVARLAPASKFAEYLTGLCHLIDPAAVERDERRKDDEAYLHLSKIGGGMWRMDGLLPDEVGTQFTAVLDALRRRLRAEAKNGTEHDESERGEGGRNDSDAGMGGQVGGPGSQDEFAQETWPFEGAKCDVSRTNSPAGDSAGLEVAGREVVGIDVLGQPIYADETPAQAMDHRFTSRRNIDALRMMLNLVASAKNPDGTIALPAVNGARPVVHLTVDIESLLAETENKAAAWLERFGVPTSVISATKAGLLACDATIEPMIIRDGQLVATLPSLQTVPAHLRKAVIARDECCRVNSCIASIDEIHHLIFLSQGGPTTMANLAGLCWFHHHLIHHGNWTLTGDANAELTLTNTTTGQQWINRAPGKLAQRTFNQVKPAQRQRE